MAYKSATNKKHTPTGGFPDTLNYPWTSKTLPASVWYRFDEKFSLKKISFTTPLNLFFWGSTPETFQVIASNDRDDRIKWDVLRTVGAAGFTGLGETRSWEIPCEDQVEYYCYGIRTTKVICNKENLERCANKKSGPYIFVTITNITMYS